MTTLENLLQEANDHDIPVFELPLDAARSIVADRGNDHAAICLNTNIPSAREAAEAAAHELGHCFTGTYYDSPYCRDNRGKMERQANVWMVKRLIPPKKIRAAWAHGCYEVWEIADFCTCTDNLVRMAIKIYRSKGLL